MLSISAANNNYHTRHLAKILIHLGWCLQESMATSTAPAVVHMKALNAAYISSVFMKYLIENAKSDNFEELYLFLGEGETTPEDLLRGNKWFPIHWLETFSSLFWVFIYLILTFR